MRNNLRVIRAKTRTTQWQLRLMTGINQSKISLAENDLIELKPDEKARIADAMKVEVKQIWPEDSV